MRNYVRSARLVVFIWVLCRAPTYAQWVEQTFNLQTGWNSLYLEVDPAPPEADLLFAGQPFAAVWMRAADALVEGPPDCDDPDDPSCIPVQQGGWRVWLPPSDPNRVVTNLRLIRGGRVYLIRATQPTSWAVSGTPNGSRTRWRQGFNLVGFHVVDEAASAPTFSSYLASSAAHVNAAVYDVQPDGTLARIPDLVNTRIEPGRGFWVTSGSDVEYDGPLSIDNASLRGIDFAVTLVEHTLEVENLAAAPGGVTAAYEPSAGVPPLPDLPTSPGDVPLSWFDLIGTGQDDAMTWKPLSSETWTVDGAGSAGARRSVRLSVKRAGLAGAVLDAEGHGSQYQGLLTITDGAGFRRRIGVVSQVSPEVTAATTGTGGGPVTRPGLYYGSVTVDQVAWITAGARIWTNDDPVDPELSPNPDGDNTSLRSTPAVFAFPIIIHLSEANEYKLLREVTLLFDPVNGSGTEGNYVLVTPECLPAVCDPLVAGSMQDGQPFARRVSTAAFSFEGDLTLAAAASMLSGHTTLAPDDPHNPFHHRYHPDHDCDQGGECYEITRSFRLIFDGEPPPEGQRPGWGDTFLTGSYEEDIEGLHKVAVQVAGRFELQRVSMIGTLNAQ